MRILVISDTHGNSSLAYHVCQLAAPFDFLIHLGDGADDAALLRDVLDVDVINVAGNCDLGSAAPRELLWECEGKSLLMLHGDACGVKYGLGTLEKRAMEVGAAAVLFGHTHCATITSLSGILAVNPGTLNHSAHYKSYAILEIAPEGISAQLHSID
jgi:putative phosphoesterase